ncbi:hypothetical protein ERJ75_000647100 [Trypanosoma vivax]|nr:hypothetical protein ERJ75_000647100 [Trypanosoma vivax]
MVHPQDVMVLLLGWRAHYHDVKPGSLRKCATDEPDQGHSIQRLQRLRAFGYRDRGDGSVVPDISSGSGVLTLPEEGRGRRMDIGRLYAQDARNVWRWRRD